MSPELALAINQCVIESVSVIHKLLTKINEVRKFKTKCRRLNQDVQTLQALLDKNRNAIQDLDTLERFQGCLRRAEAFIDSCISLNILSVSWEVLARRSYPRLVREISRLKDIFLFESLVEVLAREDRIAQDARTLAQQHSGEILTALRAASRAAEAQRHRAGSALPVQTLPDGLKIQPSIGIVFPPAEASEGPGEVPGIGSAMFYRLNATRSTHISMEVYLRIQGGAYVQRLYGVAERDSQLYAVMETVDQQRTLAAACGADALPTALSGRMQMAYDLAKTMAWYHRAEILLKSITDRTIVLKASPAGKPHAILTRLETARHFLETTSGIVYDSRYEAPEYHAAREHSQYTDVWSLGTAIWQVLTGAVPYDLTEPVLPDSSYFERVQSSLKGGKLPGALEKVPLPPKIATIVGRCWCQDPLLRPTAAEIGRVLQDTLMQAIKSPSSTGPDLAPVADALPGAGRTGSILNNALSAIREARRTNGSAAPLSRDDFRFLVDEDDDWNPLKFFVVGAVLFWNLDGGSDGGSAVTDAESLESQSIDESNALITSMSPKARRARLALYYLETAIGDGYGEAYFEAYKAHAVLAHEMKAKTPTQIVNALTDNIMLPSPG